MIKHSMTQLSNKQNMLAIHIKGLIDFNELLLNMINGGDMDPDTMDAIQDICKEIQECAMRIKDGSSAISSYASHAGIELENLEKAQETKTLKSTLDTWDATKAANAIAEAGSILPVVDNVEDIDPYTASVGEAEQNG